MVPGTDILAPALPTDSDPPGHRLFFGASFTLLRHLGERRSRTRRNSDFHSPWTETAFPDPMDYE